MGTTTRVVLVDEYDVVRSGLESWFATEPAISTIASFPAPAECVAWLERRPRVDVIVAEIQRDGHAPDTDLLRRLCDAGPAVVVYARSASEDVILRSIEAGALSYVCKSEGRDHLVAAVSAAGAGRRYEPPGLSAALRRGSSTDRITLSEREREVLIAWLRTDSKDDVARTLHIAPATVRTHLQRIRAKYTQAARRAPTKSALLARAIEDGIVGLAELDGTPVAREDSES